MNITSIDLLGFLMGLLLSGIITFGHVYIIKEKALFYLLLLGVFAIAVFGFHWSHWLYPIQTNGGVIGTGVGIGLCGFLLNRRWAPTGKKLTALIFWKKYLFIVLFVCSFYFSCERIIWYWDGSVNYPFLIALFLNFFYYVNKLPWWLCRKIMMVCLGFVCLDWGINLFIGTPYDLPFKMELYWLAFGVLAMQTRTLLWPIIKDKESESEKIYNE